MAVPYYINGEDSGRTMDGVMHLELIARKDKHTLSFRELSITDVRAITNALTATGQIVTVETNFHPRRAGTVTITMYNSSRKAKLHSAFEDGASVWKVDDTALIEQ